jgi:hypothetical protein
MTPLTREWSGLIVTTTPVVSFAIAGALRTNKALDRANNRLIKDNT